MSEVRDEAVGYEGAGLGGTAEPLTFDDHTSLAVISVMMAQQCRQSLIIVSRHLDPAIYDNEAFADALGSEHWVKNEYLQHLVYTLPHKLEFPFLP